VNPLPDMNRSRRSCFIPEVPDINLKMTRFDIDGDITRAKTLPSGFYTDHRWFDESREKIFARTWQMVSTAGEIDNLLPFTLLPGFLDEPLLFTSDSGAINCFANVCTHRGKILVEEACTGDLIRCAYHGRRFGLDGKLRSMPEFEGVEGFPSPEDDLSGISSEIWNGLVFASLEPVAPLCAFLEGIETYLEGFRFDALKLAGTRTYPVRAHWALYCENYLEGFHIPYVHPGLNRAVDYSTYSTELFRYTSLQIGRSREGNGDGSPPFSGDLEALYLFVFPNTMLNFYPWGISVNIVLPKSPDTTEVLYLTYVNDDTLVGTGAGADLDTVELEDQSVVESVQHGIRSRFYDRGRYSPSRETGTHHFHRLIAEFME